MSEWRVTWEIDVDGDGPVEAAMNALRAMLNEGTTATAFHVERHTEDGLADAVHVDLHQGIVCCRCRTPIHLYVGGVGLEWLDGDGYATCSLGSSGHEPADVVG